MYARVARWEGSSAEALDAAAAGIRERAESGPPEGLPAKKLILLQDKESGRSMAITLFETEDDYREGDETLNSMSPPGEGMGQRVGVDRYEVAIELES
ncbi:MAG TPA: hypothetical protein VNM38_12225 [Solirubrobacterales bacterium]|nr:hypothetical protein [Solirubrobacterales bacterium]